MPGDRTHPDVAALVDPLLRKEGEEKEFSILRAEDRITDAETY